MTNTDTSGDGTVTLICGILIGLAFGFVLTALLATSYPQRLNLHGYERHVVCNYLGGTWHKPLCIKDGKVLHFKMPKEYDK